MPIITDELKLYRGAVWSNENANGGRLSAVEIISGVKNNIFPDLSQAERVAGVTHYRKTFFKVANDDDLTLFSARVWESLFTPAGDRVVMWEGTMTDNQGDVIGAPPARVYGCGDLDSDVIAGAVTMDVLCELAADAVFKNSDWIWISDGVQSEFVQANLVSWAVDVATITLQTALLNSYTSGGATQVGSVVLVGDVKCEFDSWVETTAAGTYDEVAHFDMDNIGTIEDIWTLTFTSPTAFDVVGAITGAVGSGNTGASFIPSNPAFGKPYFTIAAAGWGGTWATNDTIVFATHPAAVPLWSKRICPPGTATYAADRYKFRMDGETA